MFRQLLAVLVASVVSMAVFLVQTPAGTGDEPEGKVAKGSKLDLTPENFQKLHTLIRPQDSEWRHLRVHWLTDVVSARKQAAAEDKPIIILQNKGAGYNDSLGVC